MPTTRILLRAAAVLLLAPLVTTRTNAQIGKRDDALYRTNSAEFRRDIWSEKLPAFENRTVSAGYSKMSKVILARHVELLADSKRRGPSRQLDITYVSRELIKLNDATAVKEYSSFNYTAQKKNWYSANSSASYIGVRVIKPDGQVKDVDLDEVILTKDDGSEKQAKLAIPDLQPGDILDYYSVDETKSTQIGTQKVWPFYFVFVDDAPVLDYTVHCEIGSKYAVEYKQFNGAPDLKLTTDGDDNNIMDVAAKNLDVTPTGTLWLSPFRQFPLIQINLMVGDGGFRASRTNARTPGEVTKNPPANTFLQDEFLAIGSNKGTMGMLAGAIKKSKAISDAYHDIRKRAGNMSRDSLAAQLYYMLRYAILFDVNKNVNVASFVNIKDRSINSSTFSFLLTEYFKENDLDAELLLCSSKYRPAMGEIMSRDDIAYMTYVPGAHSPIFGVVDYYTCPFYIPANYEGGKKAVALSTESVQPTNFKNADWHNVDIPESNPDNNVHLEQLDIDPDMSGDAIKILRTSSLTGKYKGEAQERLLLLEDFYNYEKGFFNETESLVEKFADLRGSKALSEEVEKALLEARRKQKDDFLADAKGFFDVEVGGVEEQKIINPGVRHTSPVFSYQSKVTLNSALKRAGNNYILDIGKLSGSPLNVEDAQRERKFDVYAPFARTIRIEMKLKVPEGYQVEGVEKIARSISNEAASFSVTATSSGNVVTIVSEKTYKHAYEAASEWPKMVAVLDMDRDWSNVKLLLKKI